MQITIYSIGKSKEAWLQQAWDEYVKRLRARVKIETVWLKGDEQLVAALQKESKVLALDPQGRQMSSELFSSFIVEKIEEAGGKLAFVIGGPTGLPAQIKATAELLSLSLMTLTHQMTRLLLIEQLYRAFEIARGSPYHK